MAQCTPYDRGYGTCAYTHVWLRVMHKSLDPQEITAMLNLEPTKTYNVGDPVSERSTRVIPAPSWFLSSSESVDSRDARHHIDWLLEQLEGKDAVISQFLERDYLVDICCRWDSKDGHGGPTLTPAEMAIIGRLGLELWFDVYIRD